MSKPFVMIRTRRMRKRRRVNQSTQTQEGQTNHSPSSESLGSWTSKHSYHYFNKGNPQDAWEKCNEVVERHDEDVCNDLKDEITFLMVVAGLFLAIVTAFTIESYKRLEEDKQDTMSDLLVQVILLLNDTSAQGHAQLPKRFTADHRDIVVNQLWFMSSTLSLVAVLIGTFCLQWISAFLRGRDLKDKSTSPTDVLGMRRLRYDGFIGWGVHHAPEVLLLIVQLSIALFTSGLVYFLWNINHAAAIPALVVASITGVLLCVVNVMPFLQSFIGVFWPRFLTLQCPYKSPTSWLVRIVFDSLALILKQLGNRWKGHTGVAGRFAVWLEHRPAPLRDYAWKAHDKSCEALLDAWHICSQSRSIGLGLSSALDILVLEPDAVDIIRHSMESLRLTFNEADILLSVFNQSLHPGVRPFFKGSPIAFYNPSDPNREEIQVHFHKLMEDFTSALILQNFASGSMKLRRILLQHRVELYIRIKNSMLAIFPTKMFLDFGRSLVHPIIHLIDIQSLDLELKFQFLNYMNRLRGSQSQMFNPNDFIAAAQIIWSEGIGCPESAQCPLCSSHQQSGIRGVSEGYRQVPGDHDTNGTNVGNLTGAQHTNLSNRDPGLSLSSPHGANKNLAEDPQFRASFRRLCMEVKEWLLSLPETFGPREMIPRVRVILSSHPEPTLGVFT